jgi:uncharacterized membrane protein YgdD (TMEM256/DUF423 family)
MNIILLAGALLGLASVVMAAFVDHALAQQLSGRALAALLTALRYHQLYSIMIVMLALTLQVVRHDQLKIWLTAAAWIFVAGVLAFSFSIYAASVTGIAAITYLTPCGGILLMAGWLVLARAALFKVK